jgi:hypothetical protein
MRRGVDHGPCFSYWRLSYRRKFIRTCWGATVLIPLVLFQAGGLLASTYQRIGIPLTDDLGWWLVGASVAGVAGQAAYTHARWQREARRAAERRTVSFHGVWS